MNDALKMQPPEKVCGFCIHLHEGPRDPNNAGQKIYECRGGPPQMVMVGVGQIQVRYPPGDPNMPACGQHKIKLAAGNS